MRAFVVVVQALRCVQLFATPWTAKRQAPLSIGFYRQEHWSGVPFPPPGDLPDPGVKPVFPGSPPLAGTFPLRPLGNPMSRANTF